MSQIYFIYSNKINLRHDASGWFYYRNSDKQFLGLYSVNNSKYPVNLQLYYILELSYFNNLKYRINPIAQVLMKSGTRASTNHGSEPYDTAWNCVGDDHIE